MTDSFGVKSIVPNRVAYEPPRAMRLSDAQTGVGSVCNNGNLPNAACRMGSGAQGACQIGNVASPDCKLGNTADPTCNVGMGVVQ